MGGGRGQGKGEARRGRRDGGAGVGAGGLAWVVGGAWGRGWRGARCGVSVWAVAAWRCRQPWGSAGCTVEVEMA